MKTRRQNPAKRLQRFIKDQRNVGWQVVIRIIQYRYYFNKEKPFDGFYGVCNEFKDDISEITKINRRRKSKNASG